MPKVLIVIGQLGVGGTELHLARVLPEVHGDAADLKIFTFRRDGALIDVFTAAGIEVITPKHERRGWLGLLVLAPSFVLTLWRERPQLIHFFLPEAYVICGYLSLLGPKAVRVMSRRSLNDYQRKYPLLRGLERWLHTRMHALLANSRAVWEQLEEEGVAPRKLGLLYNGVDIPGGDVSSVRERIRGQLGIDDRSIVFVLVANLIPYKGHRDVLDALPILEPALREDWRLLLIGRDDGIEAQLKSHATRLGVERRIAWMGNVANVADFLAAADIGLSCSHQEGFSNTVLEGMAVGLAMVVTDVGGNREAIVDEESGLLVPALAPERLARAMLRMATDTVQRKQFGAAARRRACSEFPLERCIEQYRQLYRRLGLMAGSDVNDILGGARAASRPSAAP